jgi:glucose-1-phosphate cytidylyltransferase
MKLVLLCGGQGTRLREETEFRPKPMVMVGDRPIMWHIMKHYSKFGIHDFVICLGYRGDMIKEYFYNYHLKTSDFTVDLCYPPKIEFHSSQDEANWRVTLVDTGQEALTGARLKRIERYIDGDTFMMTYGDGVSDVDLAALQAYHREKGTLATVTAVNPPARFGELDVKDGKAIQFLEKPQTQVGLISGGFFVLQRGIFEYLEDEDSCNFERGPLANLASHGQLAVYEHNGFWQCMDTYRDFTLLNDLWNSGQAPWRSW